MCRVGTLIIYIYIQYGTYSIMPSPKLIIQPQFRRTKLRSGWQSFSYITIMNARTWKLIINAPILKIIY